MSARRTHTHTQIRQVSAGVPRRLGRCLQASQTVVAGVSAEYAPPPPPNQGVGCWLDAVPRIAYLATWNLAPMLWGQVFPDQYPTLLHHRGSRGPEMGGGGVQPD